MTYLKILSLIVSGIGIFIINVNAMENKTTNEKYLISVRLENGKTKNNETLGNEKRKFIYKGTKDFLHKINKNSYNNENIKIKNINEKVSSFSKKGSKNHDKNRKSEEKKQKFRETSCKNKQTQKNEKKLNMNVKSKKTIGEQLVDLFFLEFDEKNNNNSKDEKLYRKMLNEFLKVNERLKIKKLCGKPYYVYYPENKKSMLYNKDFISNKIIINEKIKYLFILPQEEYEKLSYKEKFKKINQRLTDWLTSGDLKRDKYKEDQKDWLVSQEEWLFCQQQLSLHNKNNVKEILNENLPNLDTIQEEKVDEQSQTTLMENNKKNLQNSGYDSISDISQKEIIEKSIKTAEGVIIKNFEEQFKENFKENIEKFDEMEKNYFEKMNNLQDRISQNKNDKQLLKELLEEKSKLDKDFTEMYKKMAKNMEKNMDINFEKQIKNLDLEKQIKNLDLLDKKEIDEDEKQKEKNVNFKKTTEQKNEHKKNHELNTNNNRNLTNKFPNKKEEEYDEIVEDSKELMKILNQLEKKNDLSEQKQTEMLSTSNESIKTQKRLEKKKFKENISGFSEFKNKDIELKTFTMTEMMTFNKLMDKLRNATKGSKHPNDTIIEDVSE